MRKTRQTSRTRHTTPKSWPISQRREACNSRLPCTRRSHCKVAPVAAQGAALARRMSTRQRRRRLVALSSIQSPHNALRCRRAVRWWPVSRRVLTAHWLRRNQTAQASCTSPAGSNILRQYIQVRRTAAVDVRKSPTPSRSRTCDQSTDLAARSIQSRRTAFLYTHHRLCLRQRWAHYPAHMKTYRTCQADRNTKSLLATGLR
jgi:hypothetical protein